MTRRTVRGRRAVVLAVTLLWLLAPAVLAVARWPQWWSLIAPEQTPMTWLQSVVLVLVAAAALLMAYLSPTTRWTRTWCVLACGFAGLAVDERFALHERIRDGVLAPRGVSLPFLPWVAPGDFLLLLLALLGVALLPVMWRALAPDGGAQRALLLGVALAVLAVAMDSIDPSTWTVQAERVQQTAEEVIELGSGLALLAAMVLRVLVCLDSLPRGGPSIQITPGARDRPTGDEPPAQRRAELPSQGDRARPA